MVLYWGGSELLGNEWFVKCRCLHSHCLIGWVQWMCCGWVSCVDQVVRLHSFPCEVSCPTDTGGQWQSDKRCLQCPSQPCSGRQARRARLVGPLLLPCHTCGHSGTLCSCCWAWQLRVHCGLDLLCGGVQGSITCTCFTHVHGVPLFRPGHLW